MDHYFNNPKTIKQILSHNQIFSSARSISDEVNKYFLPFIDDLELRKNLLTLYEPLSDYNLKLNSGFILNQWRSIETSVKAQIGTERESSFRDLMAVILDEIFFKMYGIDGELKFFLSSNKYKIINFMQDPNSPTSIQYLSTLLEIINRNKSTLMQRNNSLSIKVKALNLCFIYYAAHDNTLNSLVTTAKLFLLSTEQVTIDSKNTPPFPVVKLITRFCTSTCQIEAIDIFPGDRIICILTPEIALDELQHYTLDLTFGHGIHKCPGESFVTINHEYLFKNLLKLRQWINISHEIPLASPYFSGFHDILLSSK